MEQIKLFDYLFYHFVYIVHFAGVLFMLQFYTIHNQIYYIHVSVYEK